MLSNMSAALPDTAPPRQSVQTREWTRPQTGPRSTRDNGDEDNRPPAFSKVLRDSQERDDRSAASRTSTSHAKDAEQDTTAGSKTTAERPKKVEKSKDDGNSVNSAVAVPVTDLSKTPPLQTLLALLSSAGPAQQQTANEAGSQTATGATTLVAGGAAGSGSTAQETDPVKGQDKRSGDAVIAMPVPVSLNPIYVTNVAPESSGTPASQTQGINSPVLGKPDSVAVDSPVKPELLAPAPDAKTMAFAMRLSSEQTVASAHPNVPQAIESKSETPSLGALLQTNGAVAAAAPSGSENKSDGGTSSDSSGNSFGSQYLHSAGGAAITSDKTAFVDATKTASSSATGEVSSQQSNNDPLKNVLLQLKADDNRRVDIRLVDRGGELHVSVKSTDAALAQSLQEHMPDLTSRLADEHLSHDVWMPKLMEASKSESGSSSSSNSFTGSDQSAGRNTGESGGQRQGGQSQSRPDWVDLLENQLE